MKYSFRIGSVWGIPVELHFTFLLLILAVFGLSLFNLQYVTPFYAFYTYILVLFLFVFVFFHELAHSVVARRYGIKVRKIVLYPIGGVAEIEEIPNKPTQEWRMAFAGPFTSLVLGFSLLVVSLLFWPQLIPSALRLSATSYNIAFDIAILNILLGLFNLIPAFPMDGGRVFRAILAERMEFSDATRYAVTLGKILGVAMIVFGFIFIDYFLIILVGLFVYIGASEEGEQTIISTNLAGVRVRDVMQQEVSWANPKQSLTEALEIMFKSRYHDLLVEKDGEFLGTVTWSELMKVDPEQRGSLNVEQMPLKKITIYDDESILEANKLRLREKIDLLPVVQRSNSSKVMGVLTSGAIADAYMHARDR